jgi:hypothetical protein
MPDYSPIHTSALLMLAQCIMKRADLSSLPCTTREQAIRIILGVRPAQPRSSAFTKVQQ